MMTTPRFTRLNELTIRQATWPTGRQTVNWSTPRPIECTLAQTSVLTNLACGLLLRGGGGCSRRLQRLFAALTPKYNVTAPGRSVHRGARRLLSSTHSLSLADVFSQLGKYLSRLGEHHPVGGGDNRQIVGRLRLLASFSR